VETGIQIIEGMRGHTSGLGVPTFVVDVPGGGGKIPVNPNYILSWSEDEIVLRNYEWKTFRYRNPHPIRKKAAKGRKQSGQVQLKPDNMKAVAKAPFGLRSNDPKPITPGLVPPGLIPPGLIAPGLVAPETNGKKSPDSMMVSSGVSPVKPPSRPHKNAR
jgi:hypothetical protein